MAYAIRSTTRTLLGGDTDHSSRPSQGCQRGATPIAVGDDPSTAGHAGGSRSPVWIARTSSRVSASLADLSVR